MQRILVTGPDGFVGSSLCKTLHAKGFSVRGALWEEQECTDRNVCATFEPVVVGNIGPDTDWTAALDGVDTVVHLAARVHIMKDAATDPLEAFRAVNVAGTRWL